MQIKEIKSSDNHLIKHLTKIRKDRKYRYDEGKVLLVGNKMVYENAPFLSYSIVITTKDLPTQIDLTSSLVIRTTTAIMKKITGLESPEELAAVAPMPSFKSLEGFSSLLIIDEIQDPGNLGTLFRTALAFGFKGIILTKNTCDPFNEKALRAAKGATFHVPFTWMDIEEITAFIEKNEITPYVAHMKGQNINEASFKKPFALIMSNEGQGIQEWSQKLAIPLSIPLNQKSESLNVAIAGSIIMFIMTRE
ncbi:MAG TPA: RNA methyltransferase [Chlamydiales bacterium]|nr:RNA methyltransferase [Chlamydiales bacterium]